jgi:FG-GAP repeat
MKKKINRVASKIALAIIIASLVVALPAPSLNARSFASAQTAHRPLGPPSASQGEAAIRNLKEHGLYDSLREAVASERYEMRWEESPAYPITIAPTFTKQNQLIAGDGMVSDLFGSSVAIYGNTALVGAPYDDNGVKVDQGSAYVFERGSGTSWSLRQKLTADDGAALDLFGKSVAIYGDFAVVGAPFDDIGAQINQGSAYVFARGGGVWRQHQKLTASDGAAYDLFGFSVAINVDKAIVGAPNDDVFGGNEHGFFFNTDQGSAYVFISYFADWFLEKKLTASDGAYNDIFGFSVAIHGNALVVGAPNGDNGDNTDKGSAYVFERGGANWIEQPKLSASDGGIFDFFGYSVAIDTSAYTDTLVVGAPFGDNGVYANLGSAYVFERGSSGWTEKKKLTSGIGAYGDRFGYSVAIDKYTDTIAVGAPFDDVEIDYTVINADQGSVSIFERSGGSWIERQRLTASDGDVGDWFGYSVAIGLLPGISQVGVIAGAPNYEFRVVYDQGSAYIFSANITGNF